MKRFSFVFKTLMEKRRSFARTDVENIMFQIQQLTILKASEECRVLVFWFDIE